MTYDDGFTTENASEVCRRTTEYVARLTMRQHLKYDGLFTAGDNVTGVAEHGDCVFRFLSFPTYNSIHRSGLVAPPTRALVLTPLATKCYVASTRWQHKQKASSNNETKRRLCTCGERRNNNGIAAIEAHQQHRRRVNTDDDGFG